MALDHRLLHSNAVHESAIDRRCGLLNEDLRASDQRDRIRLGRSRASVSEQYPRRVDLPRQSEQEASCLIVFCIFEIKPRRSDKSRGVRCC